MIQMSKPGKRKKNMYWTKEMDQHIQDYNAAATMEERNLIFETYLYEPLNRMAEAVISVHGRSHSLQLDNRSLQEDLIQHGEAALRLYNPKYRSFPYINLSLRNRLFFLNLKQSKRSSWMVSFEALNLDDELSDENPLLQLHDVEHEDKSTGELDAEYLLQLRTYWQNPCIFNRIFKENSPYYNVAKLIIPHLLHCVLPGAEKRKAPKHTLYRMLRKFCSDRLGYIPLDSQLFKIVRRFRSKNQQLYRAYLSGAEDLQNL